MTFAEYLKHTGVNTSKKTREEWVALREEYRKWYLQNYSKEYVKKFKRINARFTEKEYEIIQKVANTYEVIPTRIVHDSTLAYLYSEVYLPSFKDVETITYLIRVSANTIGQLVRATHIQKYIDEPRLVELVEAVKGLEAQVQSLYTAPKVRFQPTDFKQHVN